MTKVYFSQLTESKFISPLSSQYPFAPFFFTFCSSAIYPSLFLFFVSLRHYISFHFYSFEIIYFFTNLDYNTKDRFTHSMPYPCHAHAAPLPFPCHAVSLIHTRHAAPLPCSDSAVCFVELHTVAGNIRTASPTVQQIFFFFFCSVLLPLFPHP